MKREPYPDSTEPTDALRIGYFLANAEATRTLCESLGYTPGGKAARPPAGKRAKVILFPTDPLLPSEPLPSTCQGGNVPESDSGGAGAL